MKAIPTLFLILLFCFQNLKAQTITFGFTNKVTTGTSVEFDVTLQSNTSFKLGSGQVYLNYNPAAFGNSAFALGNVTVTQPSGSVLAQQNGFPLYNSFVTNDNTNSRFSFSWQQGVSSGTYPSDNIGTTAAILFHVKLDFVSGGNSQPENICFESGSIFDDQTFTACGPASFGFADCTNHPGTQILDDHFNCAFSSLPVELVEFQATALAFRKVGLDWRTASEYNSDYFVVERSTDGTRFEEIDRVVGAGTFEGIIDYQSFDDSPIIGTNYYRLKQVDFDGAYEYSEIRSVRFDGQGGQVKIWPNPASYSAQIRLPDSFENAQLTITDMGGRVVMEKEAGEGGGIYQLDLSDWKSGAYVVRVWSGHQHFVHRLVVTHD